MDKNKEQLIIRATKGDRVALMDLIKQEQNNIYTTLFYLKKDNNDIYDLVQDVLIKLASKIFQLRKPQLFKTWLNQIILNSYYDYLRKNKKRLINFTLDRLESNSEVEIPDYTRNPQDRILYNELDYIIKNSIQNLPVHYKIPIALREIQGLSYDEISNITKTTIGTVKSRIARARAMIKDDIERYSKE